MVTSLLVQCNGLLDMELGSLGLLLNQVLLLLLMEVDDQLDLLVKLDDRAGNGRTDANEQA